MKRIVILKFDEYNPRKDRRRHAWMRVENTIVYGLKKLKPEQKWFWVALLALASFKQRDWIPLDWDDLKKDTEVSIEDMKAAMDFFTNPAMSDDGQPMAAIMSKEEYEQYKLDKSAQVKSGNQLVTSRLPSGNPTYVHTDDTLHTNNTIVVSFSDLDEKMSKKLSSEPILSDVLQLIEQEIIKQWVKTYQYDDLVQSLSYAVTYYLQKTKAGKAAKIPQIAEKLIRWVNRDKKLNLANPGANGLDFLDDLELQNAESGEVGHGS